MTLLCISAARAYELRLDLDGEPVAWPTFPQPWVGVTEDARFAAAFEAAFRQWEETTDVTVSFERGSPLADAPGVTPDAPNVVFMDPDWPFGDSALAMASVWSDDRGNLVAFDIQIDPDADWSLDGGPDGYDLQAAITHEVGHALGIEHSAIPTATMFAQHGPGEAWRRELDEDDEAAVRALYPPAPEPEAGAPTPTQDRGPTVATLLGGAQCAHTSGPTTVPALLFLFTLCRRRRTLEVSC